MTGNKLAQVYRLIPLENIPLMSLTLFLRQLAHASRDWINKELTDGRLLGQVLYLLSQQ